ncbi:hypothetical protein MSZK_00440 [Mycobacterium sp. shizuoka-1]|nr:hypothetical protein MSZK_00440 [Mycobacterium sp. shizuoka-1]
MMDMDLTLLAELFPAGDNPRTTISIIPTPSPAVVGLAHHRPPASASFRGLVSATRGMRGAQQIRDGNSDGGVRRSHGYRGRSPELVMHERLSLTQFCPAIY